MKKNRWFAVIPAMVMVLAIPGFSEGSDSKKMQGNKLAHLALAESSKGSYSDCVVGDFVLKDGTILSKDETPESGTVVAVIVRAATEDKPALGVGIVQSELAFSWCSKKSEGCTIDMIELHGDTTSGYMDGSDGWEKLKAVCSDAESNPEKYPAWNYSLTYAETNGLTGDLATGWYLPTVAELYTIYQNKTAVNESLSKAGGDQFDERCYWSCCQAPGGYWDHAQGLMFANGNIVNPKKNNAYFILCSVRAFN